MAIPSQQLYDIIFRIFYRFIIKVVNRAHLKKRSDDTRLGGHSHGEAKESRKRLTHLDASMQPSPQFHQSAEKQLRSLHGPVNSQTLTTYFIFACLHCFCWSMTMT